MRKRSLQLQQLNQKMVAFTSLKSVTPPPVGWIKAIRNSIGMSMQQLGNKLSITKQSVQDMEKREVEGSITIRSLREIARALDMQFVYALVPIANSMDELIEKKAKELATKIVLRTSS